MGETDSPMESALVVPVVAAEPAVRHLRELYDPAAAWGVPAHITVLYPFVPPAAIDGDVLAATGNVLGEFTAFDFTLERVDQFGTEVLMITPKPADRFSALTEALVATWPEHQPYGGIHEEVIPHLTIAHTGKGASFDAIRARVRSELPIHSRADAVDLMVGSMEPNSWQTIETFHLS